MSDEQTQQPETKSTAKRKAAQQGTLFPGSSIPTLKASTQTPQGAPKALTKAQQLREALRARQADVKRTGDGLRAATKALKGFLKTANTEHVQLLRAENRARKAWDKAVAAAEKAKSKLNGVA